MVYLHEYSTQRLAGSTLLVLIAGLLLNFGYNLYRARRKFDGLPKPPYNPLLGHIPVMAKAAMAFPPKMHPHCLMQYIQETYDLPPIFYVDTWPLGHPICVVVDRDAAQQCTVQESLPKHEAINEAIWPIVGHNSLVAMGGQEHKKWRNLLNPGFSNAHLMTFVDKIVDDTQVFLDVLSKHADAQDIVQLEELTTRVTVDVIGRVVLDMPMNAQTTKNEFVSAFRNSLTWLMERPQLNPFILFNPLRPFFFEYNKRTMNRYLGKVMDDRYRARSEPQMNGSQRRSRAVIDLALDSYAESTEHDEAPSKLDPVFRAALMDQMKVFMFGGHDTTSSTICYIVHALTEHPEAYTRVLEEYDEVFGTDVSQTARVLKNEPYLINRLPYTVAIIKEVLRLWPPASSVRAGKPGFFLHYDGKQWPTEGFMTWPVVHAIHHSPSFWPKPWKFIPERWLAKEGDPLFPMKGAWRPFEHGPRNCIGQELAMIESKIIMVMMLRQFEIKPAYEEWDRIHGGKKGKSRTPRGERAYQVLIATGKPADGMPARVTKRSNV